MAEILGDDKARREKHPDVYTKTGDHKHTDANPAELDQVEARQGSRRMLSTRVLIFSTFSLALVFALIYLFAL